MVHHGKWGQTTLTLSIKTNCTTLSLQATELNRVYSFDLFGRLWTAMSANISYRRGLNGKTVAKWIHTSGDRERRWLTDQEAALLEETARQTAIEILTALNNGQVKLSPAVGVAELNGLATAAQFNETAYQKDIRQFSEIYKPVGILPPDQYMAVVLQAAEGCSFNTCTFCDFYKKTRFHIKTNDEFKKHLTEVHEYLADGLSLRRTIFLGDANALVIPTPRLLPMLETVHQVFDVESLGGIYAFLDGFSGEKKTAADYRRLSELGVRRIYLGVESGHDELLAYLKKPGKSEDAIQAVHAMKEGGIAVGVIILLGAGGKKYATAHARDTIAALDKMQLDAEDILYFSELVENEGLAYTGNAFKEDLAPLSIPELTKQGEIIEQALSFSLEKGTPHISRYDIREFVY